MGRNTKTHSGTDRRMARRTPGNDVAGKEVIGRSRQQEFLEINRSALSFRQIHRTPAQGHRPPRAVRHHDNNHRPVIAGAGKDCRNGIELFEEYNLARIDKTGSKLMNESELKHKLKELLILPHENEVVEFKEAENRFEVDKIGKYFSALSNEANLKNVDFGWLVFGIRDSDKSIVGSNFRTERASLDNLKGEISAHTTNGIGFVEIYELRLPEGRVVLFQIPKAMRGIPTAWKGHYYGREGDSTSALSDEKRDRIRNQNFEDDWSAAICPDATITDLDPEAIKVARLNFKTKFPSKVAEVDGWDDLTFLNKAKVTIQGRITRTAIILLGRSEAEHFVSPAEVKIRWILKDTQGLV